MVRFVTVATALALTGLQVRSTEADNYGFRGGGRVDCKLSDWSPFEACNDAGFKTQTRYVVVEPSRGGSPCQSLVFTTRCSSRECWMGKWNDWTCNSGSGMKQRTRVIATGGLQTEKKCPKKVERAGCDPIPCELNTLEEDVDNPWGECKLKRGVWTKSKALGVKWPAQYGGLCYEETHPVRRVSMTCPPVDCVVTPVEQDTGDWGPCTNSSNGVWTKTKTLGVTPALYFGAACSESSRVATASCAKDCKISTTEYDEWTACDANNNKYHPFKILQKTEYGGVPCPPIEQRADNTTCGVDCVMSEWSTPSDCAPTSTPKQWARTSTRTIVTNSTGTGALCGELEAFDYASCLSVDCVYTDTYTCALNAAKNWVKAKTIAVTTTPSNGGDECPVSASTPTSVSCDAEHFCGPATDVEQKALCVAAVAKSAPLTADVAPLLANFDYTYGISNGWQCIDKCASTPRCEAFIWFGGLVCALYSADGPTYEWTDSGAVYGKMLSVKSSCALTMNTEFVGNDITTTSVKTSDACCLKCKTTGSCKAFTFKPDFHDANAMGSCVLKTAAGVSATNAGAISGVVAV